MRSPGDLSEYLDYGDALQQIGRFLDDVCTHKRIHSSLGYLTPAEFEAQWLDEQSAAQIMNQKPSENCPFLGVHHNGVGARRLPLCPSQQELNLMNSTEITSPSLDAIDDLDWCGLKYFAVRLALELDIFTTIAEGCCTLEEISEAVRTSKRGARILLDALCPLGLLRKAQSVYSLTPTSEAFFVRGKPACCADAYLVIWRGRDKLMQAVRTGTAPLDIPGPEAEEMWASYAAADLLTWPQRAVTAHERWTQLGITKDTKPGWLVLDAACGSGVGSFVLAQADSSTRVIAFDFAKVLAVASQVAEMMGVREQVSFHPGNLLTDELPDAQFDVVLLGAILYYFKPEDVIALLRRLYHALKSDGLVVIRSLIADEDRCQNEMALVLALELLHDAPHGEVYTFSEYRDFLETAGFTDVNQRGESLISAKKYTLK